MLEATPGRDHPRPTYDISMAGIGARIRQARLAAEMSQDGLGKLLGISGAACQTYEAGRNLPPLDRLQAIADVLQLDLAWLALGMPGTEPAGVAGKTKSTRRLATGQIMASTGGRYNPVLGTTIPVVDLAALHPGAERPTGIKQQIVSHFPCGPGAVATKVWDRRNAPEFNIDDLVVIDPDVEPMPGSMVVVAARDGERVSLIMGKLRVGPDGLTQIVAAMNPDWGAVSVEGGLSRKPDARIQLVGVVTEHSIPQRA